MSAEKIAHVGIVAANGDEMVDFFVKYFDGVLRTRDVLPERMQISSMVQIGDCELEIMEGTSPEGVPGKFLAKRGPGLHHISIQIKGLVKFAEELEAAGIQLIGKDFDNPEMLMAFVSPKSTGGVLIELYERV